MILSPQELINKRILIAPLDWGMGHVTRCIPLVEIFLQNNNEVIFAGTNEQIKLIQKDFPSIITEKIQGYNVELNSTMSTYWQIFNQTKKLKRIVLHENKIANELVDKYKIDFLISDNRYGFYSKTSTNIFITHQLNLQIPFFKSIVNKKIEKLISKFDFCWIPDDLENPICGVLTKSNSELNKCYIGHLSRFKKLKIDNQFKYLLINSGPEPERSRFFEKISLMLDKNNHDYISVGMSENRDKKNHIQNPDTRELEKLIAQSEVIITRAGYTSIMEMISLQKKAIMIPTKGQYEQEFLSKSIQSEYISFIDEEDIETYISDS